MNTVAIKNRVQKLEAEVGLLKRAVVVQPDFGVDTANWEKMRPTVKKIRAKLYKKVYGR